MSMADPGERGRLNTWLPPRSVLEAKNKKEGDITLHYIDILAMYCRVISPFYFCSFSCEIYV